MHPTQKKEERPSVVIVATSIHFKLKGLASITRKEAHKVTGEVVILFWQLSLPI